MAGTRTSSKNVSLKPCFHAALMSGRMFRPGVWMSSMSMNEMPRCFGASGFVRTSANSESAWWAPEVQIFWPLMTYSSPSRLARVCSEPRSDPAPGSE